MTAIIRVLRSMLRPDAAHVGASTRSAFETGLWSYVAATCGKLTSSVCTLGSWLLCQRILALILAYVGMGGHLVIRV